MVELVRERKGATLVSRLSLNQFVDQNIVRLQLAGSGMNWHDTLCHSSLRPLSEAAQEVHRRIRAEVKRLVTTARWPARLISGGDAAAI